MKLTLKLKQWLTANRGVAADADDDTFKTAALEAIKSGDLDPVKMLDLTKDAKNPAEVLEGIIAKALKPVTDRLENLEKNGKGNKGKTPKTPAKPKSSDPEGDDGDDDGSEDLVTRLTKGIGEVVADAFKKEKEKASGGTATLGNDEGGDEDEPNGEKSGLEDDDEDEPAAPKGKKGNMTGNPVKLFTMGAEYAAEGEAKSWNHVRVKKAIERYDSKSTSATYTEDSKHVHLRGRRASTGEHGHELDHPSEQAKAVSGAWFKFMVNSALRGQPIPRQWRMNEHDNQLVQYALHEMKFTGLVGYNEQSDKSKHEVNNRKLNDFEMKAILDDSLSGGLEAAPIVFDDAVIITPLLFGEFYPLVNVVNLTRGRRVEGFSIANPTITSGTSEGTEISLFNTAAFIAAFDTTIYNAVGSIELGLDFEEDSPVGIGDIVVQRYGDQFLRWLDEQICIGDGTTEPQGFFVASSTTAVSADNGNSGPPTLSDYEGLLFGLQKQFRSPQDRGRTVFASNEVTYRRSRGMKVDPAAVSTDERRLMGMDHENYSTLGHPHKISHQIANTQVAMINLRYYRMYRRLGLQVRVETGGKELARKNEQLIIVRARFGGQLELGGACAVTTNAKS